jgi:hypothetical protein
MQGMTTSPHTHTVSLPSAAPRRPRRRNRLLLAGAAVLVVAAAGAVTFAPAASVETTTVSLAGVREIVVDLDAGPVSLRGGTGPEVILRTTRHGSMFGTPEARHRLDDGVLTVEADCGWFGGGCHVSEDLTVPAGVPVQVRTTAGGIDAVDLDVPRFAAETAAGPVSASFVRPPAEVRAVTAAGSVALRVPDVGYTVDADTAVGSARVGVLTDPRAERSLYARSAAGDVAVLPR